MLPLSLLVGLATGMAVCDRRTIGLALWVGLVASLAWGLFIGVAQGRPLLILGGFALAFANHLVGFVFGAGLRGGAEFVSSARDRVRA